MGMQAGEILSVIEPKNFQNFLNKVGRNSEKTRNAYENGVKHLTTFLQKPHPDDTISIITKVDPYDLIDSFTGWLIKNGYKANTVLTSVRASKKWLRYQGLKIYNEELKDRVDLPTPEEALDDAPTRSQIKQLVSPLTFPIQNKMLGIACSGIRLVDIPHLRWSDFKWDEHPVRVIVPAKGKTKRGWETFVTDELAERLKIQQKQQTSEKIWPRGTAKSLSNTFRKVASRYPDLNVIADESKRGKQYNRYKLHVYSLKKFFFSQVTAELGDAIAHAWCGRKAYLAAYLRLPLEERQKLYMKTMPRLSIFSEPEKPKADDTLRERLKTRGLTDEIITKVLEGLVFN